MQEAVIRALEIAAGIGADFADSRSFDNAARRTGTLVWSSACVIRRAPDGIQHKGRMAITSTLLIVRGIHPLGPFVGPIRLNVPMRGFRYRELTINLIGFIPYSAVEFSHQSIEYQIFDMDRRRFAHSVGSVRSL